MKGVRARATGVAPGTGLREAVLDRAHELGLLGWVRSDAEGEAEIHAEGEAGDIEALLDFVGEWPGCSLEAERVKPEGHEHFAVRGVPAGAFAVTAGAGGSGFELRLEVDGAVRRWTLPKGPSMDPAVKRMAIELPPGPVGEGTGDERAWDRGDYEQGGRVPWPEAIERGHAVFVLHGQRLRGGFALQRTRGGEKPQWLMIKRRDGEARPGSDVVAEFPDA